VELVATVGEDQDVKAVLRALDKVTQEYKKERANG
jgi:hypothetical protein